MSGSAGGEVIREFLVSIGYQERGKKDFTDSIGKITKQVVALGVAAEAAAVAVTAAVAVIASGLESLYFASRRTGASVESIKALGFAAEQMGSSVGEARATLENLGRFLRTNPGGEGFIQSLGVSTRAANGSLRDTSVVLQDLGAKLKAMPYFQANAYAGVLGIDEKTLMALMEGVGEFADQYHKMYAAAGIDAQKAAKDSHDFMVQLRTLGSAFSILQEKVASLLTKRMGDDIRRFREALVNNFQVITRAIVWVAEKFLTAADIVTHLALRTVEAVRDIAGWFGSLSAESQHLIEAFALILVGWRLLNAGFLASPLGAVLALGAGLVLLYDDYKTFKEHGSSLIDWGKWQPGIDAAQAGMTMIHDKIVKDLLPALRDLGALFAETLHWGDVDFGKALTAGLAFLSDKLEHAVLGLTRLIRLVTALSKGDLQGAANVALEIRDGLQHTIGADILQESGGGDKTSGGGSLGERLNNVFTGNQTPGLGLLGRIGHLFGASQTFDTSMTPQSRGLLDTIAGTESPGYNVRYGGQTFSDMSKHPNIDEPIRSGPNQGKTSSAAGRYQFIKTTWDEAAAATGVKDFSPASQDKAAWWLAQRDYHDRTGRDLATDLKSSDPAVRAGIGAALSKTWTSLPGGIEAGTTTNRFNSRLDANTKKYGTAAPAPALLSSKSSVSDMEHARGLPAGTLSGLGQTAPLLPAGTNDNSSTNSQTVTVNQATTINIHGEVGDAGRQVMDGQRNVNQDLARNLQPNAR